MRGLSFLAGKTVLITGATGLIGSNIVDRLMSDNSIRVIVVGRNIQKIRDTFSSYWGLESFIPVEHDISNSFPRLNFAVDYIFHAAGPIAGSIIKETPVDVIKPNLFGLINCLEFVRKQKEVEGKDCRTIVFSSATVYSSTGDKDVIVSEGLTNSAEYLNSITAAYSESKRMCEVIANAYYRQYKIDVVLTRFAYVYGYTKKMPDTAFYEFIQKSLKGENLVLNSTGAPRRDNIYIDDAVDGLLCLCEKGNSGESYNISSGGDLNNFAAIDEIADAIAKAANKNIAGSSISVSFREQSDGRKPGIVLDNGKLKALGWSIENSLEEGVNKTMISYIA